MCVRYQSIQSLRVPSAFVVKPLPADASVLSLTSKNPHVCLRFSLSVLVPSFLCFSLDVSQGSLRSCARNDTKQSLVSEMTVKQIMG
jgi:hypothetical protein